MNGDAIKLFEDRGTWGNVNLSEFFWHPCITHSCYYCLEELEVWIQSKIRFFVVGSLQKKEKYSKIYG